MRLTRRAHRLIITIMFISGITFGLLWPYVPISG
jgi:hypothetical protein